MTSVQYLSDANFSARGNTMNINMGGIVFVMFKTNTCPISQAFTPIFERELPSREQRISFAIANVDHFRNIVTMSQPTNTPIKSVPTLILYINGNPVARYKGEKTATHVLNFIQKILEKSGQNQVQQQFMPQQRNQYQNFQNGAIPGKPTVASTMRNDQNKLDFQDLKKQNVDDARMVPAGTIPHNAPYWNLLHKDNIF